MMQGLQTSSKTSGNGAKRHAVNGNKQRYHGLCLKGNGNVAILLPMLLLILLALIATVASVPTSVLAQNTELSTNLNQHHNNNNNNNNKHNDDNNGNSNNNNVVLSKVKRSSNELNSASTSAPANKKSSPEIVPATFNNAPAASITGGNQAQINRYALPSNSDIMEAVEAAANAANERRQLQQQQQAQYYASDADNVDLPNSMQKRGINAQQYLYDPATIGASQYGAYNNVPNNLDYYNNPYAIGLSDVPNGVWTDEPIEPVNNYGELQDIEDYVPVQRVPTNARNKAYDNLQNLLNTEAYLESVPLTMPLTYAPRNYGNLLDGERKKRGGYYNTFNKYNDLRLKRDNTKLTPADMLALVALVEAGERARKETDADAGYGFPADNYAPKTYAASNTGVYDYNVPMTGMDAAALGDVDYNAVAGNVVTSPAAGTWLDGPAMVDYYGVPVNMDSVPKYEIIPREQHQYNGNRFGMSKRFMVSKKKRSLGKFLNEPVKKPSMNYGEQESLY